MEYSRARGSLPPELSRLQTTQVKWAIDEANLGLADAHIAHRRFVDQLCQVDIAMEMGFSDHSTVSKRLKSITPRVVDVARNIPQ